MAQDRVTLFGLAFDRTGLPRAVAAIAGAVTDRRRGYVVTPNIDHIVRCHRDQAFAAAYADAAWRLPDGMPLVWASRVLGEPLPERVAGADLLPALCDAAARLGFTVFVLGGREGVAQRAGANLAARFPGLRIAGVYTPPDRFEVQGATAEDAIAAVNRARPDILFVGLGAPTQELWVHRHWDRLATTVAVCCGAAIDFAAGVQPRAPAWMQRVGLEWLWRLAREPRRLWRRYLVEDTAFVGIVLKEWWRRRGKGSR